jgi:hypothetical protein
VAKLKPFHTQRSETAIVLADIAQFNH